MFISSAAVVYSDLMRGNQGRDRFDHVESEPCQEKEEENKKGEVVDLEGT